MMSDYDWVSTDEDTPPLERGFKNVSRNVLVLLDDGAVIEAYYAYHQARWLSSDSKPLRKKVCAWCDL